MTTYLPAAHEFTAELPTDRRCLRADCGRRRSHGIHRDPEPTRSQFLRTARRSTYRTSGTPRLAQPGWTR